MLHDLCTGRLDKQLVPLQVVFFDGKWYTRNNRTLYVLKRAFLAERVVPVIVGVVDRLFFAAFHREVGRRVGGRPRVATATWRTHTSHGSWVPPQVAEDMQCCESW